MRKGQVSPVIRDGWATLFRWHRAHEKIWRIEEDAAPELPDDLPLSTAPIFAPGVCYIGPARDEWIVVARHAAAEPIIIAAAVAESSCSGPFGFAFPEAMITYLTMVDGAPAAGCLNLEDQPMWGSIYLPAGKRGEAWLHQDDIAIEERRFHRALRHWYRPPAIVI